MRVLMIKGESAYNASRAFLDDLAAAFRRAGCEAAVIDGVGGGIVEKIAAAQARGPFDLIYTINIGGDWRDGSGRTLSQRVGAPHVIQYVDHPLTHYERLDKTARETALLLLDRNHVAAVRSVYGPDHFAYVGFSPAGAAGQTVPIEDDPDAYSAARPIPILFPGTYQAPPADPWAGLPAEVKGLLDQAAERQLANEATTALDALDETMVSRGLDPLNPAYGAFRKLASHINDCVRFRQRLRFLDTAAAVGLPLHVYGGGYAEHLGRLNNITYLGEADLGVVQAEMRRARVVMNINANFYRGAHDRPFTAGAAGAATASDFSAYLAEEFIDGRSIQFFHWSNIEDGLEEIGRLASNPEKCCAMAKAGQARVVEAHLWDHRIATILEAANAVRQ